MVTLTSIQNWVPMPNRHNLLILTNLQQNEIGPTYNKWIGLGPKWNIKTINLC